MSLWWTRLPEIHSMLLMALFFVIPIHVSLAYTLTCLMLLVWLLQPQRLDRCRRVFQNPVVWMMWGYYAVYLLGMLWTENIPAGWRMMGKQSFFLLFPIYLSGIQSKKASYYIGAFVLSVTMCEVLAYYNWLQLHFFKAWPKGIVVAKDPMEIAPFVDHIMYSPILAMGAYLLGHSMLFDALPLRRRLVYALFLCTMTANIFISGGRAGQVVYLSLMGLLLIQHYSKRPLLAVGAALAGVLVIFGLAYVFGDTFRVRADLAWAEIHSYQTNPNTSVGLRMNWAITSWQLFLAHPWFGVGTGDFTDAFAELAGRIAPGVLTTFNPHNQYLFALTTTGLLGGLMLFLVLYMPLFLWRKQRDKASLPHARLALVVLFTIINFSESYFWRSNTSLMFVAFSALFYAYPRLSPSPDAIKESA